MSDPTPASQRFRRDIDLANTWVVSDTHFGHDNIVGYCHRPEDHEQVMIAEWRRAVPDDATLLHLGDLCYKGNAFFKHIVSKELTGARKLLIKGNHDRNPRKFYTNSGFTTIRPFSLRVVPLHDAGLVVTTENDHSSAAWTVSFSHYAWDDRQEQRSMRDHDLRLHGHIHNNGYSRDAFVPFLKNHINMSLEQTRYTPVNLKLLLDAAILGRYPETTQEQHDEVARRKAGER